MHASLILPPPIPLRYTLSTIEPQRLISENEDLRRRNLDLEYATHSHARAGMTPGHMAGLAAEVDYLRGLSRQRLHEIDHWQLMARGRQPRRQIDGLEAQIERSVGNRLDEDMRAKIRVVNEEMDRVKAENMVLMKNNMGLQEEVNMLRKDKSNTEVYIGRSMDQAVASKVREEARKLEDAHLSHDRRYNIEIADLRNQVAFLQNELNEKDSQIRGINREYVENVVVRKEHDTRVLATQFKAEIDLTKLAHDKIIDDLTAGNRELRKRVSDLESVLSKQRIDHSSELDQLKGTHKSNCSKMAAKIQRYPER